MERRRKTERTGYRSSTEILRKVGFCIFASGCAAVPAAAQNAVAVAGRYDARVAHVEVIGTLFTGKEEINAGSGLLVGDKFILTNNHFIFLEQNYKSLRVAVRLKSRLLNPLVVGKIYRDEAADLALLELADPYSAAAGPRCPMPVIADARHAPMGTTVFIMGYPRNQDLSIAGGLISNHNDGKGRWQTDTLINPGNSGGPAFDSAGSLIGIAAGGAVKWEAGGQIRNVTGVNFIIPTITVLNSPLFANISSIPTDRRCWVDYSPPLVGSPIGSTISSTIANPGSSVNGGGAIIRPPSGGLSPPARLTRTYFVSETKSDHPNPFQAHTRAYQRTFQAEPGFRITDCKPNGASENHHSDVTCNIEAGQGSATFSFKLTGGPAIDRWRGWWDGTINLQQELR